MTSTICWACSSVPPFDRYAVIPVARNVGLQRRGDAPAHRASSRPSRGAAATAGSPAGSSPASASPRPRNPCPPFGLPAPRLPVLPGAVAPSAPGQRNSPHPSRLPRLKRGSCAPDVDRPYATPFAEVDPCTLPDDFAGWPRGVGQAAGSTRVDHVHRAPEMDLCPGGPASDGCPVGSLRRRAPVQGPAGIEARPFDSARGGST